MHYKTIIKEALIKHFKENDAVSMFSIDREFRAINEKVPCFEDSCNEYIKRHGLLKWNQFICHILEATGKFYIYHNSVYPNPNNIILTKEEQSDLEKDGPYLIIEEKEAAIENIVFNRQASHSPDKG